MSKSQEQYSNAFESWLYDTGHYTSPFFSRMGITPNQLTFASYISSILSAMAIAQEQFGLAAFWFASSTFLDTWDGTHARLTGQTSAFGDWFDHTSDWAGFALMLFALVRIRVWKRFSPLALFAILLIGVLILGVMALHVGCELNTRETTQEASVADLKLLCSNSDPHTVLQYTRWCSYSGFHVYVFIFLIYLAIIA